MNDHMFHICFVLFMIINLAFLATFNPLKMKRRPLYLKTQSVPRCKHFSSQL
jgi:hypothetical protein